MPSTLLCRNDFCVCPDQRTPAAAMLSQQQGNGHALTCVMRKCSSYRCKRYRYHRSYSVAAFRMTEVRICLLFYLLCNNGARIEATTPSSASSPTTATLLASFPSSLQPKSSSSSSSSSSGALISFAIPTSSNPETIPAYVDKSSIADINPMINDRRSGIQETTMDNQVDNIKSTLSCTEAITNNASGSPITVGSDLMTTLATSKNQTSSTAGMYSMLKTIFVNYSIPPRILFACLLAASAGWNDVRTLREYGCMINLCTGNTIRIAMAIAQGTWQDGIMPGMVVTGYVIGVGLARWMEYLYQQQQQQQNQLNQDLDHVLHPNQQIHAYLDQKYHFLSLPYTYVSFCKNTCYAITPFLAVFFVIADVFNTRAKKSIAVFLGVWVQSIAYGLMHETASTKISLEGRTVLFGLTGHWASISRCTTDYLLTRNSQQQRNFTLATSSWMLHLCIVSSLISGVILAVWVMDFFSKNAFYVSFPISTGLFYVFLFLWFGDCLERNKNCQI